MGNCTSSDGPCKAFRLPPGARVIYPDGRMEEFRRVITARDIIEANPGHFLCSSETMQVDSTIVKVEDQEQLQFGQLYFLLPLSQANRPLGLPDLCALAVKASAAVTKATACIRHLPVESCRNLLRMNYSIGGTFATVTNSQRQQRVLKSQ